MTLRFSIFIQLLFLFACKNENIITNKDYPYFVTKEVTMVGNHGVKFEAKILELGNGKITDFGFICTDKNNNQFIYSLINKKELSDFSVIIETDFVKNNIYNCSSYIKTNEYFVTGNTVTFTSQGSESPQILSIFPTEGFDSSLVSMKCKYLNSKWDNNVVFINDIQAPIYNILNDTIIFRIPLNSYTGETEIKVKNGELESLQKPTFNIIGPKIESISKSDVHSGEVVTITGKNLLNNGSLTSVTLGKKNAVILNKNNNSIEFLTPYDPSNLLSNFTDSVFFQNGLKRVSLPQTIHYIKSWNKLKEAPFNWSYFYESFTYKGLGYIYEINAKNFVVYQPENNTWSTKNASIFPGERNEWSKFVVVGEKLYKFGGIDYLLNNLNELWEYDLEKEIWKRKNNTPFSTQCSSYTWIGGQLYVITEQSQLWKCDFENEKYIQLSSFPAKVQDAFLHAFSINDELYVVIAGITFKYDFLSDTWIKKATNNFYFERYSPLEIGFSMNNTAYVLHSGSQLYKYDKNRDIWFIVSGYPIPQGSDSKKTIFTLGNKAFFSVTSSSNSNYSPFLFSYQEQ